MREDSKILVIDDDDSMRESCCMVFDKDGYEVTGAEDGIKGLEKVNELKPDLVLVDLKMPGISGMEVLEKIHEIDPDIVPVVITGYATIDSAVQAMKKGAYDFLPKPFSPDELRIITTRALEKRQLILKSKKLELEKERMKEKFISMVSHQLKSPIAAVLEYFEVILGGMAGDVNPEQEKMLARSKVRLNGLLKLIQDWLSMARMESDGLARKFDNVDLKEIIKTAIDSIKPLADQKNIKIEFEYPEVLSTIHGDVSTLTQAFINLLDNGVKYNKDNGSLKVSITEKLHCLTIEISDSGIGIPEGKLPFIFEEFYQCGENAKVRGESNGLGLAIVKRIIDAHLGSIYVKSKLGEGSVFSVLLPIPKNKEDCDGKR